VPVIFFFRNP